MQRFARHMEEERIRQRMQAGDRWVAERMTKIIEVEDLAEVPIVSGGYYYELSMLGMLRSVGGEGWVCCACWWAVLLMGNGHAHGMGW